MEDILDLYEQPYDPKRPVVCFDERPCQLVGDILVPLPMSSGNPQREHYEYKRNGTCCLLVSFEPHTGQRFIEVREHRTKVDYAHFMKELAERYPEAEVIRLVQDNLNTHSPGAFYQAFPPEAAFELSQRFECHYTPKKGSWLNMAEIELSALAKQCLDRRLGDIQSLAKEVHAWEEKRNRLGATVRWRFSKDDARRKFHRHYCIIQD